MDEHHSHEGLMKEVKEHLKVIFEESKQSIYLILDDENKICNKKFASLLGYKSPEEWANVKEPFATAFVEEESHDTLISAYQNAMNDFTGSSFDVEWKKKSGGKVKTKVILIPFLFKEHFFALHFIE
jgi:oligoribonuclease NrnB/cAMP/cGMP phosphodiesterase (DHH superfamily)